MLVGTLRRIIADDVCPNHVGVVQSQRQDAPFDLARHTILLLHDHDEQQVDTEKGRLDLLANGA